MTRAISALGESALLLPASSLLFLYLLVLREGRLALGWVGALAAVGLGTIGAKLAFRACGQAITEFDVVSPSGHASFAAVFYGAVAILLAAGRDRPQRVVLGGAALGLVLAIGASRVRLDAHSPEEVAIGLAIGGASLALFALVHARAGRPVLSPVPLAAGFAVALLLLGGQHLPVEGAIAAAARRLSTALDVCALPLGTPAVPHGTVTGGP